MEVDGANSEQMYSTNSGNSVPVKSRGQFSILASV